LSCDRGIRDGVVVVVVVDVVVVSVGVVGIVVVGVVIVSTGVVNSIVVVVGNGALVPPTHSGTFIGKSHVFNSAFQYK